MKTLVWVEHDGTVVKDATLAVVTAASKLGEVHLLVAGSGDRTASPPKPPRSPASPKCTRSTTQHSNTRWPKPSRR